MKVYLQENKLYYSEIEVPSLGKLLGDFEVTQEEMDLGTWNGDRIIITDRARELNKRTLRDTDLNFVKQEKIEVVKKELIDIINSGYQYQGVIYDSDSQSIQNIHGAYTIFKSTGIFSGSWWDRNNIPQTMTGLEFATFAESFFDFQNTKRRKAREIKDEILSLATIALVKEYIIEWT